MANTLFAENLKKMEHDGVIVDFGGNRGRELIAFYKSQIKNAIIKNDQITGSIKNQEKIGETIS